MYLFIRYYFTQYCVYVKSFIAIIIIIIVYLIRIAFNKSMQYAYYITLQFTKGITITKGKYVEYERYLIILVVIFIISIVKTKMNDNVIIHLEQCGKLLNWRRGKGLINGINETPLVTDICHKCHNSLRIFWSIEKVCQWQLGYNDLKNRDVQ